MSSPSSCPVAVPPVIDRAKPRRNIPVTITFQVLFRFSVPLEIYANIGAPHSTIGLGIDTHFFQKEQNGFLGPFEIMEGRKRSLSIVTNELYRVTVTVVVKLRAVQILLTLKISLVLCEDQIHGETLNFSA